MGSYTPIFKLYKPSADEFVDVNTQVNPNFDTIDQYCKKLMEYTYFTGVSVSDTVGNTNKAGERWYKTYSNSLLGANGPNNFFQDTYARVDPWVDATQYIDPAATGWVAYPGFEPAYRIISSPSSGTTEVEWTGRLWIGGGIIQTNVTNSVLTGLPAAIIPTTHHYFQVYAGNTTNTYAVARVLCLTTGKMELYVMGGGTSTSSQENYVDLGGIKYNLEVTA